MIAWRCNVYCLRACWKISVLWGTMLSIVLSIDGRRLYCVILALRYLCSCDCWNGQSASSCCATPGKNDRVGASELTRLSQLSLALIIPAAGAGGPLISSSSSQFFFSLFTSSSNYSFITILSRRQGLYQPVDLHSRSEPPHSLLQKNRGLYGLS